MAAPPPTEWSSFIFPPQQSSPLLNFNTQDAVNVSWTTPEANASRFDTLELILWWSAPINAPFAKVVNETVPLNGSRVFSTGYGLTFPAVGFFALFYLTSDGSVINGPGSLGFNVSNTNPLTQGRLWSEDGSDTALSNPPEPSATLSSAFTTTVTVAAATVSGSETAALPSGGLGAGAIAGIVVGVALFLLAIFFIVLFLLRRSWQAQLNASKQEALEFQERFEHIVLQPMKSEFVNRPASGRLEMENRQRPWPELQGDPRRPSVA